MKFTLNGKEYGSKVIKVAHLVKNEVYAQKQKAFWDKFLESGEDEDFDAADEWWLKRVVLFLEVGVDDLHFFSFYELPLTRQTPEEAEETANKLKAWEEEAAKIDTNDKEAVRRMSEKLNALRKPSIQEELEDFFTKSAALTLSESVPQKGLSGG